MSHAEAQQGHETHGAAGWLRRHARPQIVLPAVIGVGLVSYVISIAVAPKSGGELWAAVRSTWWIVLILTIPYLAIRAFVWRQLLHELGLDIPWRPFVVSFAGGEMTKVLPAGIYAENYLLARLAHFRARGAIRSSMATTAMLGLESLVAVPALLILGIPHFPWLRLLLLSIVGAWLVVLALAWTAVRFGLHHREGAPRWLRSGIEYAGDFFKAGRALITWRTLALTVPTALYLLIYAIDLSSVTRAVGVRGISLLDAIAIYAFVALTVILIPIPTEIGLTEFSGLKAILAYGISQPTAAIIMLSLRALVTGMTMLVAGIVIFVLRSELSAGKAEDG